MANTTQTRVPAIEATISDDRGTLSLVFSSGQILKLHVSQIGVDVAAYALMHGLKQKLVDAAAISRNPDTGRSATIEDKYNAVREVYERLLAGQWNKTREGGAGNAGGLLLAALCRLYPAKTPEQLREFLAGKSDAEKAALRANAKVAAIIAQIKAERATDAPDTDAMLDELAD